MLHSIDFLIEAPNCMYGFFCATVCTSCSNESIAPPFRAAISDNFTHNYLEAVFTSAHASIQQSITLKFTAISPLRAALRVPSTNLLTPKFDLLPTLAVSLIFACFEVGDKSTNQNMLPNTR